VAGNTVSVIAHVAQCPRRCAATRSIRVADPVTPTHSRGWGCGGFLLHELRMVAPSSPQVQCPARSGRSNLAPCSLLSLSAVERIQTNRGAFVQRVCVRGCVVGGPRRGRRQRNPADQCRAHGEHASPGWSKRV
jgi:hypothetical protein